MSCGRVWLKSLPPLAKGVAASAAGDFASFHNANRMIIPIFGRFVFHHSREGGNPATRWCGYDNPRKQPETRGIIFGKSPYGPPPINSIFPAETSGF